MRNITSKCKSSPHRRLPISSDQGGTNRHPRYPQIVTDLAVASKGSVSPAVRMTSKPDPKATHLFVASTVPINPMHKQVPLSPSLVFSRKNKCHALSDPSRNGSLIVLLVKRTLDKPHGHDIGHETLHPAGTVRATRSYRSYSLLCRVLFFRSSCLHILRALCSHRRRLLLRLAQVRELGGWRLITMLLHLFSPGARTRKLVQDITTRTKFTTREQQPAVRP